MSLATLRLCDGLGIPVMKVEWIEGKSIIGVVVKPSQAMDEVSVGDGSERLVIRQLAK